MRTSMTASGFGRRAVWIAILVLLGLSFIDLRIGAAPSVPKPVVSLEIKGAIGVATAMHVARAVAVAQEQEAALILLTLDTPGGLVSSTRDIIQSILASPVPVAVYVAPSGAHAASAGTYITYAAHVAAMAPGTSLGAATPVPVQGLPGAPGSPPPRQPGDGEQPAEPGKEAERVPPPGSAMERKVLNDAIAFMRALAEMRGRNVEWAERAVREAATLTASEAANMQVVDMLADSREALLEQLDGREVHTVAGSMRLATRGASVVAVEPDFKTRVLGAVADPNIAFVLLLIGIYGLLFEFWSPGFGITGTIGAVCLLLALIALSMLPVQYGGLALLLLGLALMTGEALTPGVGALGLGGLAAFVVGTIFLYDPAGADIAIGVAKPLIAAAALTSALLFVFVLGYAVHARRRTVRTGAEQLIGAHAEVREWQGLSGAVHVHGEIWSARGEGSYEPGTTVVVTRRDGLTLFVQPVAVDAAAPHSPPEGAQPDA